MSTERPPAGTKVWVIMEAEVKPDRYQDEAGPTQTIIEIDGGWGYAWETDELLTEEPRL